MRRSALIGLLLLPLYGCARSPVLTEPETALRPACSSPAPLEGFLDPRAPGYFVILHSDFELDSTVKFLSAKYSFVPVTVYRHVLHGFFAELSVETVAGLRCEPSVTIVAHNAVATLS
jgi:hypothetical protein